MLPLVHDCIQARVYRLEELTFMNSPFYRIIFKNELKKRDEMQGYVGVEEKR